MKRNLILATILFWSIAAHADDWPAWRGPGGQGHSAEKNLPLKWSKTENIKWKMPLAEVGNSTPIVFRDRIFLTQATKGGATRSLLCFAKADGKLLWQRDVAFEGKERVWNQDYYCSASPVTDGERVVVSFASAGMHCFDFQGKELWKRTDLGTWQHGFGNGSSPVLYGNLAILFCGPNADQGRNWLLAVDKKTGKTVWELEENGGTWATPLITNVNGQDQLILSVAAETAVGARPGKLKGLDPKTGKELWFCTALSPQTHTSALHGNGIAVDLGGRDGGGTAVKLGGSGDITKDRLWTEPRKGQRVGSGVIVGDHVYLLEDIGVPHCYELATGNEVWKAETRPGGGGSWSSMVHADGRLYVLTKSGDTVVFAASPKFQLLATNPLGEQTNASIAVSDGELFIRTAKTLWCISAKK